MSKWNLDFGCVQFVHHVFHVSYLPLSAWPGRLSPAAWARPSPPSTPTPRPSSSSDTSARPSSRASGRSTRVRLSGICANTPCTPFPNPWTFIQARPRRAAGKCPSLPTLWTWVTWQARWGRNSAEEGASPRQLGALLIHFGCWVLQRETFERISDSISEALSGTFTSALATGGTSNMQTKRLVDK